ncbi:MAG: hypothetical protein K1W28_18385 [Lachnospiraceae bacterium]
MYQERVVLCGASAYEQKYYLNQDFEKLPVPIQEELKIMCVLFTEDVGGVLTLVFDEEGNLLLETAADEGDLLFDEIGSELKIRRLRKEKAELLLALEMYYRIFFLGEVYDTNVENR